MLKKLSKKLSGIFASELEKLKIDISTSTTIEQLNLKASYQLLSQSGSSAFHFNSHGFKVFSQHEEDGLIWYIFSLIGQTNVKCIEVCAGNGMECNTANLIINHGWIGLLFDGSIANTRAASQFYTSHPNTKYWPPIIRQAWITRDNINSLIEKEGFDGEIDLFSLDIDGIDYWLWKELSIINPRLVVLEFNHLWGPNKSVSVPYDKEFRAEFTKHGSDYAGASLTAFVKLAKEKGYRLVGTNRFATNAFFLRDDIRHEWLPGVSVEDCFFHPRAVFGMKERRPLIEKRKWVEV